MPRPFRCRRVAHVAPCDYFKPAGVPLRLLDEVTLGVDELEALRLADLEGLYHEEAAGRMGVSRATFGRIVGGARRKVAEALVHGKAIAIQGGQFRVADAMTEKAPGALSEPAPDTPPSPPHDAQARNDESERGRYGRGLGHGCRGARGSGRSGDGGNTP